MPGQYIHYLMTSSIDEFFDRTNRMMEHVADGTARLVPEPLAALADPGTLRAESAAPGAEVTAATAVIRGVPVVCYAMDGTRHGGALTAAGCQQIVNAIEFARRSRRPVVGLWHSGGASLHEGRPALDGVGRLFHAIVAASGVIPQISVVLGPAAGGAAYGPALTDIVVMSEDARIFVTGPAVVADVTGQQVTAAALGGPDVHGRASGVAHVIGRDTKDCLERTADLVWLLGRPGEIVPGIGGGLDSDPARWLPASQRRAYDIRPLAADLLDDDMLVLHERWAPNVFTAFGRLAGRTVGIVANNPIRRGGCLNAAAGDKAARFVRLCDAFAIPLIVLVDVPGYLPGLDEEHSGVVRRGAKLLHAFAAARTPRITVIIRKAYGGAYIAMNSKSLGATAVLAWPTAEIGIMNPGSAVDILHRRELAACATDHERSQLKSRLTTRYAARDGGLQRAVQNGALDAVIEPRQTRETIVSLLAGHPVVPYPLGNIPL
jgi:acetyl-CoA/propionyl-CoA carboxylase carboxyl transferase subunit